MEPQNGDVKTPGQRLTLRVQGWGSGTAAATPTFTNHLQWIPDCFFICKFPYAFQ